MPGYSIILNLPGFNLVLENLLISTLILLLTDDTPSKFQSRTRESSYFNEYTESHRMERNNVSISYSRIFLFQLSLNRNRGLCRVFGVSISYSRIFLFQLRRFTTRLETGRATFQSRTRESSYFNCKGVDTPKDCRGEFQSRTRESSYFNSVSVSGISTGV